MKKLDMLALGVETLLIVCLILEILYAAGYLYAVGYRIGNTFSTIDSDPCWVKTSPRCATAGAAWRATATPIATPPPWWHFWGH